MPSYQDPNQWQRNRYDIGTGGTNFNTPLSDDDRGGCHDEGNREYTEQPNYGAYGGYYGGYGGYFDPVAYQEQQSLLQQDNAFLGEGEKWGEVDQTTLEELQESGALMTYGPDAVLMIVNGPEDMKQLNQEQEAQNIAGAVGDRQTVVLWNPSPEAMEAMLKQGGFQDVVISGHGDQGVLYMTGEDGTAVAMEGDQVAAMFEDTGVQNVFINACHGAGGEKSVAQSLAQIGVNAMGWTDTVKDSVANEASADWAAQIDDGGSLTDLETVAATADDLTVTAAEPSPETAPAATPAPEATPVATPVAEAPAVAEPAAAVAPDYTQYLQWSANSYMWV